MEWLHLVIFSIVNSYHENRIRRVILERVPVMGGNRGCDTSRVVIDKARTISENCGMPQRRSY